MQTIHLLQRTRQYMKRLADEVTEAQLTRIPDGYNNHILWHLGHVVVTQQILHYQLAGLPMYVDEAMCNMFKNGTSPKEWQTQPAIDRIFSLMTDLPEKLLHDYEAGRFQAYQERRLTRAGFDLKTIEDAIAFNNFHEGVHTGYVMAMKRLVG